MLNAKALTELLSRNRDDRLCRRWYLMTPNGTLLAYSQPNDINDLRKQAALAAIAWQEHEHQSPDRQLWSSSLHGEIREEDSEPLQPLHVLTIESDASSVLIRRIQTRLLLVLEGGVPPGKTGSGRRITREATDGTQQQSPHGGDSTSIRSSASGATGQSLMNVLKLQRTKLDALAEAIIADFQRRGFKMPEDGSLAIF